MSLKVIDLTPKNVMKLIERLANPLSSKFALTLKITNKEIKRIIGDVEVLELAEDGNNKVVTVLPKTIPAIISIENEEVIETYTFGEGGWNDETLITKMSRYDPDTIRTTVSEFEFEVMPIYKKVVELYREEDNPIDEVLVLTILLRGEDSEVRKVLGDVKILPFITTYENNLKYELIAVIPRTLPCIVTARTLDIVNPFTSIELKRYLEMFVLGGCPRWGKSRVRID